MQLSFRNLREEDFDDVISWRSDPVTMQMSRYSGEITKDGFRPVFNRYLENPSFIVEGKMENGDLVSVGIINLTLCLNSSAFQYEIGINFNPKYRGMRLSKPSLQTFLREYVVDAVPGISNIVADIKQENVASISLFSGSGFHQITSKVPGYLRYLHVVL